MTVTPATSAATAPVAAGPAACVCCGGVDWAPHLRRVPDYVTDEAFDVLRCRGCGLGVTWPQPPEDALPRYYPPRYRTDRHGATGPTRTALRARAVVRRVPGGSGGSGGTPRLLDVGAGSGDFAAAMQARGWHVEATELDPSSVERLRARGIPARTSADAAADPALPPFDAITCWHVLEHTPDPGRVLAWVRRAVAPGGVFQVSVPNFGSWQARLAGPHWLHLDVPRHLFHFTPAALRRLLAAHGFAVVASTTFAWEYDWFGAIQSPLNAVLRRRNVLFERLTGSPDTIRAAGHPRVDVAASYLLSPPVAAATLLPTLVAPLAGAGATLTLTCRPA